MERNIARNWKKDVEDPDFLPTNPRNSELRLFAAHPVTIGGLFKQGAAAEEDLVTRYAAMEQLLMLRRSTNQS